MSDNCLGKKVMDVAHAGCNLKTVKICSNMHKRVMIKRQLTCA